MNKEKLEVEVKFFVPDLGAFRRRLLAAGAAQHKPRIYERNVRFDNAWEGLRRKGQLLRLRQDAAVRLTFKGVAQNSDNPQLEAKVREELEVEVGDFDTLATIFERLGLEAKQVYEKYRETFRFGDVEVVLDEMPFGNFVELEGDGAAIKAAAASLELDWARRILDNYLALMARLVERYGLPFQDVTFANFEGLDISVAGLLAHE
jgi:adenylate cyclase class 2